MGLRDVLELMQSGGFAPKAARQQAASMPRVVPEGLRPEEGPAVTWVGHASTVIRIAGRTYLTDPVWSTRLPGAVPRLSPPGVPWEALPRIDGVLVSHDHFDHLDAPTIKRLPRDTPIHCGLDLGGWFRRRGFTKVKEHDWWEPHTQGGVTVTFVPVEHWCQRWPLLRDTNLWGGWVVRREHDTAGGVLFAGDTAYHGHFRTIAGRFPALDVVILPIGAYSPRWFMRHSHMDPQEAVQAFLDLGAAHVVAMHWGTFPLSREPVLEPPELLRRWWYHHGLDPARLHVLPLGGTFRSARPALAGDPQDVKGLAEAHVRAEEPAGQEGKATLATR